LFFDPEEQIFKKEEEEMEKKEMGSNFRHVNKNRSNLSWVTIFVILLFETFEI